MTEVVLITGGTGFVGGAVVRRLQSDGERSVVSAIRSGSDVANLPSDVPIVRVAGLGVDTDWSDCLPDVTVAVHCAARVHVMQDEAADPLRAYRNANVLGTMTLARQAAAAGVRRFVFLSSIKVNGEMTAPGRPFRADDAPAPEDAYAISKWEAEQALLALADETGMEVVIIRPPLVYGPGVKGNFASMLRWVAHGVPLPLGAVRDNRRSLVALDNLVDLIVTCIDHRAAANKVFLAGDGEDLSTAGLIERLAAAMGRPARLIDFPPRWIDWGVSLLGKKALGKRLLASLQVDISETRRLLGWTPPITVDEGLRRTVASSRRQTP